MLNIYVRIDIISTFYLFLPSFQEVRLQILSQTKLNYAPIFFCDTIFSIFLNGAKHA